LECGSQRCQERGENGERWTSYRYCVHPSSRLRCNEIKIHKHDADFENRDNLRYCIVQSNSLDGLRSRAENQARKYAEMLRMVIPNTMQRFITALLYLFYIKEEIQILLKSILAIQKRCIINNLFPRVNFLNEKIDLKIR